MVLGEAEVIYVPRKNTAKSSNKSNYINNLVKIKYCETT